MAEGLSFGIVQRPGDPLECEYGLMCIYEELSFEIRIKVISRWA